MERIKILFLVNTLGNGGAERVCINLINNMNLDRFDVHVRTMFSDGSYRPTLRSDVSYSCKYAISPRGISKIYGFIPAGVLYKYFIGNEKYDVIVAYLHGAATKVISGCPDETIKTITWLHNGSPDKGSFFDFWMTKRRGIKAYKNLDAVVGVSESVTSAFGQYTGMTEKLYTVYNTNDVVRIKRLANESKKQVNDNGVINICSAGRLSHEKGFDRLINVGKRLRDEGYSFCISIMGQGAEQNHLLKMIKDHDVDKYIKLLGYQENPYSIMAQSDLYVLSSRDEGLATVLTEAMIVGLPVVATDVSGTKEVLGENSEYGLVVENSEDGVYSGLKAMLDSPELMQKYKEKAIERAKDFATEKTVAQAEALFEMVVGKS